MADQCLFCRIASGEIPATIIAQSARCVAFRDINPQAPVHALVIPREHVTSLNTLTDGGLFGEMSLLAAQVAKDAGVAESGWRLVANTGHDGGQSVFHVHVHVLGGRPLRWPPG
ncbi:MAG: histidine triad nucleotide-binding protein [Gemmatimonadetes bacterium]|nr:histidine triad nucleotide-binding protein [Gemmatimonadota bacterium]MBI3568621.1 histidine triad nucleotide-binding protein [Gemmatimonadota bacterium]